MLHAKINTCQALLDACQALIDQSIRHFGNNCTSVRHYGLDIRHSGNHPSFLVIETHEARQQQRLPSVLDLFFLRTTYVLLHIYAGKIAIYIIAHTKDPVVSLC